MINCEHDCKTDSRFVHSFCHDSEPTWIEIVPSQAIAIVRCAECDREITTLLLRSEED